MSNLTIHSAALQNHIGLARSLLSASPTLLNSKDADGRTALHVACSSGSLEVVRLLMEENADLEAKDAMGWTPLLVAVSAGHVGIVKELIGTEDKAKVNVNATNDKGITSLHYAASKGRTEIGKLLVDKSADANAKDRAKQVPLHRAATTNATGFMSMLLTTPKIRLNTTDNVGNTPLHLAMESAYAAAAVLLIEAGADRGRMNADGQTAEELEGVGGVEQKRARQYVVDHCGPPK